MIKLLEHEIFAEILGNEINMERLERIGYSNGNGHDSYSDSREYIISHVDYFDNAEYVEILRLTDTIKERWNTGNIDFSIYIYLKDGKVTGGHIFKYKETASSCHLRPTGYEMEPTQQEIRIAKRILEYVTEKRGKSDHESRWLL